MTKTLLLGLGGTGSRVVNNVAKELRRKKIGINDGEVCCAVLDTNEKDNKLILKTGTSIPVIPTSKDQTIGDYFEEYDHLNLTQWAPPRTTALSQPAGAFRRAFLCTCTEPSRGNPFGHGEKR